MLQAVDALDGEAAGSTYLVDFEGGVRVVVEDELGSTLDRLGHHLHAVGRTDAQLHTGLHGGLDVFQRVGDAAGSHGRGGGELLFGQEDGHSHLVEEAEHQLFLLGRGVAAGHERHALAFADGRVGDEAEHGHFLVRHVVGQLLEGDACGHREDNLAALDFQLLQDGLYQPGLHGQDDEVGARNGFLIVVCHLHVAKFGLQGVELALRGVRHDDVRGVEDASLGQSAGDGSAHVSCSDDGCSHNRLF